MIIGINGYAGSGKDAVGKIIQLLTCANNEGVGHDRIVELLNNYKNNQWWIEEDSGWEIKKWAGKLKQIASMLTDIPVEKFEDQEFKKTYLGPEWNYWTISVIDNGKLKFQEGRFTTKDEAEGYVGFMEQNYGTFRLEYVVGMQQMTVRQFLQELGTDGLRKGLHPNTWVNALMSDYKPTNGDYPLIKGFGTKEEWDQEYIAPKYPNWVITDTRFINEAQAIKDKDGVIIRVDRPGVTAVNAHPSETGLDNYDFDYKIANVSDLQSLVFTVEGILKELKIIS